MALTALGVVFWAGALFVLMSVTPVRVKLAEAIPDGLRTGSARRHPGLFWPSPGFKNARFLIVGDRRLWCNSGARPQGLPSARGRTTMLPDAPQGRVRVPRGHTGRHGRRLDDGASRDLDRLSSPPDFSSVLFKLDIRGALKLSLLPAIVSILFTDLFDSISTFVGVAHATGLVDDKGRPLRLKEGLIVDAFATLGAGLAGTSSGTAFIESAAGIEMGGRTGWTAVFCALAFLPCFFLGPVAGMVPAYTDPAPCS